MKQIGTVIKEQRIKSGMTQEQLAAFLNISYQAVSKWENGVSLPDLPLIVSLTKLFGISSDELLGIGGEGSDQRYEELMEEYDESFRTGDPAARQSICEIAVVEYPGDFQWLCNLAWVLSERCFEEENSEKRVPMQEKAIRLFDAVIKNCRDELLRGNAIQGIIELLSRMGRKEEAQKYVGLLPERSVLPREAVLANILEGDELIRFRQQRMMGNLVNLLGDMSRMTEPQTGMIRRLIETLFPDGNLLAINQSMYYVLRREIDHRIDRHADPHAVEIGTLLDEMKGYAEEYDRLALESPGIFSVYLAAF